MKRILFAVLTLALGFACAPEREQLRSGDLVFVGIPAGHEEDPGSMSAAISASTGRGEADLIHVGIVEVDAGTVYVIDATRSHGVARRPLEEFIEDFTLEDGSLPVFLVKRLKDPGLAGDCIDRAKALCGVPYDLTFLPGSDALYCSELVRESYRTKDGGYLFEENPMNWKDADGIIPPYWAGLFEEMGMEVPQGVPGTNPQDMAESALLETVRADVTSVHLR